MGEHYAEDVGVGSSILSFLINLYLVHCSLSDMKITRLEDIEKSKHEEKTDKITEDINRVMDGVFKKPKKNKNSFIRKIGKISLVVLLLMVIVNLVLGNVWLLKFFWSDLF